MKFSMYHYFDWPVEKITSIMKAGEDLYPMEDLQNVSARKRIRQERVGSKIHRVYEWCVHGQIPKIAQKIIRPDMLTFTEETVWDDDLCSFTSKITPHFLGNTIYCVTSSTWSAGGENRARRHVESTITINIPVIGPVAEKAIVDHFKKNNDQSAELVRKHLALRYSQPAS